jgi:hypothetical protein
MSFPAGNLFLFTTTLLPTRLLHVTDRQLLTALYTSNTFTFTHNLHLYLHLPLLLYLYSFTSLLLYSRYHVRLSFNLLPPKRLLCLSSGRSQQHYARCYGALPLLLSDRKLSH